MFRVDFLYVTGLGLDLRVSFGLWTETSICRTLFFYNHFIKDVKWFFLQDRYLCLGPCVIHELLINSLLCLIGTPFCVFKRPCLSNLNGNEIHWIYSSRTRSVHLRILKSWTPMQFLVFSNFSGTEVPRIWDQTSLSIICLIFHLIFSYFLFFFYGLVRWDLLLVPSSDLQPLP